MNLPLILFGCMLFLFNLWWVFITPNQSYYPEEVQLTLAHWLPLCFISVALFLNGLGILIPSYDLTYSDEYVTGGYIFGASIVLTSIFGLVVYWYLPKKYRIYHSLSQTTKEE